MTPQGTRRQRCQWCSISTSRSTSLVLNWTQKHIYSETLIVYDSIRPTKLYNRSYDAATDSTTIDFGVNLKMTKKSQDVISGNTINNCSVLAAFGKKQRGTDKAE